MLLQAGKRCTTGCRSHEVQSILEVHRQYKIPRTACKTRDFLAKGEQNNIEVALLSVPARSY